MDNGQGWPPRSQSFLVAFRALRSSLWPSVDKLSGLMSPSRSGVPLTRFRCYKEAARSEPASISPSVCGGQ
jgi:hypothetical protein